MDMIITFKKGKSKTLKDVTKVTIYKENAILGHDISLEELKTCFLPSDKDINIVHSEGNLIIAKNTFESIDVI